VADAGGGDAHKGLALMGFLEVDGLDRERGPDLAQDSGSGLDA